jgi:serine/threonine protein kinase
MGEVYRATDTRLHRDVALKMLPAAMAADRSRLDRFEQEARATAALNHPNIVAAYDVGTFDGVPYVVSELLEGATLREQLALSAPFSARVVIEFGRQIARGVAAAHARGIVHRDLKPENIFVTRESHLKILDFGLAKLAVPNPAAVSAAMVPTQVETALGTVLGSNGYMAPEQVRALDVDHRADIFSFGAILYELLSGRRAFHGDTPADTATAILTEDPPSLDSSAPGASPGLIRIIERCLEKAPERRFQSASDLAFALDALSTTSGDHATEKPGVRRLRVSRALAFLLGSTALGVLVWLGATTGRQWLAASRENTVGRFSITPPPGSRFNDAGRAFDPRFALSPNGRSVAFVAQTGEETAIWLRPLDALEATKLAGTEGVMGTPFWAPNGSSLAFFVRSTLKAIDLSTGSARTVCEGLPSLDTLEGSWSAAGTILLMGVPFAGAMLCPVAGGAPRIVSMWFDPKVPASAMSGTASHPQFLPDGRHFLFTARNASQQFSGILVSSVRDDGRLEVPTQLLPDASVAAYASGYLFFARDGVLMAQPMNGDDRTLSGNARPLTRSVEFFEARAARIAASAGVVLYSTGHLPQSTFVWMSSDGAPKPAMPTDYYGDFALSRDGKQLAVVRRDPRRQTGRVWVMDLAQGGSRMIGSIADGATSSPVWSHDLSRVAYARHAAGRSGLVLAPAAGGIPHELLVDPDASSRMDFPSFTPQDWSSDSSLLLYSDTMRQLFALPVNEKQPKPVPVTQAGRVASAAFSPDRTRIAYAKLDDGSVHIAQWPAVGTEWKVSGRIAGTEPQWSSDGRTLYFRRGRNIMRVSVTVTGAPAGEPQLVVSGLGAPALSSRSYVATDDRRFMAKQIVEYDGTIIALVNWATALNEEF